MTAFSNGDITSDGGGPSLPLTRYGAGGDALLYPSLTPPTEGEEFERVHSGIFW